MSRRSLKSEHKLSLFLFKCSHVFNLFHSDFGFSCEHALVTVPAWVLWVSGVFQKVVHNRCDTKSASRLAYAKHINRWFAGQKSVNEKDNS